MNPFSTFALLYMVATFLELGERWTYPVFTGATLVLIVAILRIGLSRITFLGFLIVTTLHFVTGPFPDVANHVNLVIACNVMMMTSIVHSLVASGAPASDDAWFTSIRPLLQLTLILTYFLAGFHKLNADFFNVDVSCVTWTIRRLRAVPGTSLLGVPALAVMVASGVAIGAILFGRSPWRRFLPGVAIGVVAVGAVGILALPLLERPVPEFGKTSLAYVVIASILAWELVGGPALAIPRLQLPVLVYSWTMHAALALVGFVDFGSLAVALLAAFVPTAYLWRLGSRARIPATRWSVPRPILYLALALVVSAVGLQSRVGSGILFNLAVLVLAWPLLQALVGTGPRPAWPGVPITARATPRWLFVFPALLVLHASTAYVGLRTAGNFSMFSNLRTEGERSNHLLLASNPLKVWGFQEDVVHVIEIDDRTARIGYQYQPLLGNAIPVVEFRKLIYQWTRAGAVVPITVDYRGVRYATADIANEPDWRTPRRDLAMYLMDFRVIQPTSPNECRW